MITDEQLDEWGKTIDAVDRINPATVDIFRDSADVVCGSQQVKSWIDMSRTAMPSSIAEVRRLNEENAKLKQEVELSQSAVILANTRARECEDGYVKEIILLEQERDDARRAFCITLYEAYEKGLLDGPYRKFRATSPFVIAIDRFGRDAARTLFPPKER